MRQDRAILQLILSIDEKGRKFHTMFSLLFAAYGMVLTCAHVYVMVDVELLAPKLKKPVQRFLSEGICELKNVLSLDQVTTI